MLESQNKVTIPDLHNNHDLAIEINQNQSAKDLRVLRVTMGETTAYVKYEDLYALLFVMGTPDEQMDLMPVRQTTINKMVKQHKVIAKKDIKKGEFIIVNCSTDVPTTIVEGLRGILSKEKKSFIHRV